MYQPPKVEKREESPKTDSAEIQTLLLWTGENMNKKKKKKRWPIIMSIIVVILMLLIILVMVLLSHCACMHTYVRVCPKSFLIEVE